jgi:hypothetical protein
MIYFIGNREQKVVKIGFSNDVTKRIKALQTSSPYELEVFKVMEGNTANEQYFHILFKAERLKGEWFKLTDELFKYIEDIDENFFVKNVTTKLSKEQTEAMLKEDTFLKSMTSAKNIVLIDKPFDLQDKIQRDSLENDIMYAAIPLKLLKKMIYEFVTNQEGVHEKMTFYKHQSPIIKIYNFEITYEKE